MEAGHVDSVEIVLAEALNNIVEHAYAGQAEGTLQCSLRWQAGQLTIDLTDHGVALSGLPTCRLPPADGWSDTASQDLPEGGFGWGLIRTLSSQACYCRCEGRNHLCLVIVSPGQDTAEAPSGALSSSEHLTEKCIRPRKSS